MTNTADPAVESGLRVTIVNTSFAPDILGGAERSVGELADELRRRGHYVTVVCLGRRGDTVIQDEGRLIRIPSRAYEHLLKAQRGAAGKALWHVTELFRVVTAVRLRRVFRADRPDVVHFNNLAGFGWLAWLVARPFASVQTFRDYALLCTSATGQHGDRICRSDHPRCRVLKWPFKLRGLRPDVATAVSAYTASRHVEGHLTDAQGRVDVVYNSPLSTTPRSHSTTEHTVPVIGFIGRVAFDKGIAVLFDAFRRVHQQHQCSLLVAGPVSADDRGRLEEGYGDLLSKGAVRLAGPMTADDFYSQVDVVAVPTQWQEPFGRVAAEALMAGTPLLYSRVGGLPEVAELYGGTSTAVDDAANAESWADALQRAFDGRFDTASAALAGPSPSTDEYLLCYREAIARHRART